MLTLDDVCVALNTMSCSFLFYYNDKDRKQRLRTFQRRVSLDAEVKTPPASPGAPITKKQKTENALVTLDAELQRIREIGIMKDSGKSQIAWTLFYLEISLILLV